MCICKYTIWLNILYTNHDNHVDVWNILPFQREDINSILGNCTILFSDSINMVVMVLLHTYKKVTFLLCTPHSILSQFRSLYSTIIPSLYCLLMFVEKINGYIQDSGWDNQIQWAILLLCCGVYNLV